MTCEPHEGFSQKHVQNQRYLDEQEPLKEHDDTAIGNCLSIYKPNEHKGDPYESDDKEDRREIES